MPTYDTRYHTLFGRCSPLRTKTEGVGATAAPGNELLRGGMAYGAKLHTHG